MIFIINRLEQKAMRLIADVNDTEGVFSVKIGDDQLGLAHTSNKSIMKSMTDRYPQGDFLMNDKEISKQYFIVKSSSTVINPACLDAFQKDPTSVVDKGVELEAIHKAEFTKEGGLFHPKNMIVVISPIDSDGKSDRITMDKRNLVYETELVSESISVKYFIVKWANWGSLTYPIYINVNKTPIYKLNVTHVGDEKKFVQNSIDRLTEQEIQTIKEEMEAKAQAKKAAQAEKSADAKFKRPYNDKATKRPYNNGNKRHDNNGSSTDGGHQKTGGYYKKYNNNNTGDRKSSNDGNRRPYNGQGNGNRKPNNNSNYRGNNSQHR